ncbi:MAG TPA: DUF4386 domain-containing protein [Gemmatimonadaceae bacterium]|nr:DUF4386 domain-containing protein [Gemmatimonadaceae bacterium]
MSTNTTEPSPLLAARIAGALWLIVIVASIASVAGMHPLDWRADPAALVSTATSGASTIRLGFAVRFLGKVCYVGVTILLYQILKPVNRSVALFSAFCGLAGLLSGINAFNDFTALSLLEESRQAAEPLASQLQASARTIMATHSLGSGGEDVFFGFQIAALGVLITRSRLIPRAIGAVLLLGGAGFLIVSFTNFLSPALGDRLGPLVLPIAILGEGSLTLWLLLKGVNVEQWRAAVAQSSAIDWAAQ